MEIISSKEQKELKKFMQGGRSRGLGDTIAKMTSAVGIRPCGGCKRRQEYLNKKVPYKTKKVE